MVLVDANAMKPHLVLLPSPGMGHVTPMLELAKRLLLHHSCHVTFLHITTEASDPQTRLLHSPSLPPSLTVLHLPPADPSSIPSADAVPPFTRLCVTVRETLLRSLKPTLSHLHQKPQALITDLFCTQAFDACAELSIPTYVLCTTSARFFAFLLFIRQNTTDFLSGEFLQLPGCPPPIRADDLPHDHNASDDYWCSYHICRVPTASGIFLNTFEDLEPGPVRAIREDPFYREIPLPPVFPIGPLVKETEPVYGTGEGCLAWLDKQPSGSVLFVALGSGGCLCAEQLTELAWGLELSQQRFLWVVRAPTRESGMSGFLKNNNDGSEAEEEKELASYLPDGFVERNRGMGMVVESWAPQAMVVRHVSIGAFLSHCGWNSVLESLCNGVPLIAWPLYGDQYMNAVVTAEEMGVAVAVKKKGKIGGREEVERAVRGAMEGEEGKVMRQRAREVRDMALKASERGGTGYEALAAVANQWKEAMSCHSLGFN